jgi:chemosensory pili system protein ChpA (sensor histidine kinase/response regulator)
LSVVTPEQVRPRRWIVVVDDDTTVRQLLIDVLEQGGYAAVGAEDGYVAEDLIRDIHPDLILLDLKMPRSSGVSLLSNLRQQPRLADIPVLIVSGYLDPAATHGLQGANVVGKLEKPIRIEDLLDKVRQILQKK